MSSAPLLPAPALAPGDARDIGAVEAIMMDAFDPAYGEAWTRGQCLGVLAMPEVALTLARIDGRPAGFAMQRRVLDEAELLLLAVARAARGRGAGSALLAAAIDQARAGGAAAMFLEVRSSNPAITLYRAHGFVETGVRRAYYRGIDGRAHDARSFRCAIG